MTEVIYQGVTFLFLTFMLLAVLSIVYVSLQNGISPMPSSGPVRQVVTREISKLHRIDTIVEAGSGFGTLALHIARNCPQKRIIGIENSWIPLWISRLIARLSLHTRKVSFIRGNLYTYSYDDVDVVVCYLFPGAMNRLSTLLREQLAPGARVISVCFALPNWEPDQVITCRDLYRTKVYMYSNQ